MWRDDADEGLVLRELVITVAFGGRLQRREVGVAVVLHTGSQEEKNDRDDAAKTGCVDREG